MAAMKAAMAPVEPTTMETATAEASPVEPTTAVETTTTTVAASAPAVASCPSCLS